MKKGLKEIGARIKEAREKNKLSQAALGSVLGVKAPAVSKYEKGDNDPGILGLIKIAEMCGVPLNWLIFGREDERPREMSESAAIISALNKNSETREMIGRELLKETLSNYETNAPQNPLERTLLSKFRRLHPAEKERVIEIAELYASAKDQRNVGGGGKNLRESNCE
jgi:transcriptional regulator with XRE-family HTH domain